MCDESATLSTVNVESTKFGLISINHDLGIESKVYSKLALNTVFSGSDPFFPLNGAVDVYRKFAEFDKAPCEISFR